MTVLTAIQPAFWHADAAQAANYSLLQLRTRQDQRKWDSDNGKAIATITNHLDPDIAKRYDDNPLEGGNLAHHMLADLNARYGGVYMIQRSLRYFYWRHKRQFHLR